MNLHHRLARHAAFESLEHRRLMAAAAAAAVPAGFERVAWNGQDVLAKPGQWLVQLADVSGKADQQLQSADAALKRVDPALKADRHLGRDGLLLVKSPADAKHADLRHALQALPNFVRIEPDLAVFSTAANPNDPSFNLQWGLNNTGHTGGVADADVDAPEAWEVNAGDPNVVVGVIDSGVDYNHPDLVNNIWTNPGEVAGNGVDDDGNGYVDDVRGWDFYNNDADPYDDNGHGTSVAGVIGATGNNGIGTAGVGGKAKILPLKFMAADGAGTSSGVIAAINYATAMKNRGHRVMATNNSWTFGSTYVQAVYDAVQRSAQAGMLFVAAAGNGGSDYVGDNNDLAPSYPASFNLDNVISVAATDHTDTLASFSNYGAASVDVAAPGLSIYSTLPAANYGYNSGTSVASPFVAGVAALAWSRSPNATVAQVRGAILGGADAKPQLSGKVATGGRLNAYNALQLIGGGTVTTTPPAAPTLAYATSASASQINLIWADNSNNEAGFRVYRSTGDWSNLAPVADLPAGTTSYASTSLTAGTTYYYCVAAFNSAGESSWSNVTWATTAQAPTPPPVVTLPSAPSGLTVTATSKAQVTLRWTDNSGNETGFEVERSLNGTGSWSRVATVVANTTTFTTAAAKKGGSYWFRVRAVNSAGASAYSNSATTATSLAVADWTVPTAAPGRPLSTVTGELFSRTPIESGGGTETLAVTE